MISILNIIITFVKSIKWTPLKISIGVNIILGIVILFLTKSVDIDTTTNTMTKVVIVDIPSKIGTFPSINTPLPIAKKIPNPINNKLLKDYIKLNDSLKKLELYVDAITERDYKEIYEDSIQKIDVSTTVQGKLLKQSLNYFIKPSTITTTETTIIKPYSPTNKILIGGELRLPPKTDIYNPVAKVNLMFQNKKDNIISLSFDSDNQVWIGYTIKL